MTLLAHIAEVALPALVAIILHELAHGYAAWALGDDTARRMGRLSFNPLRHVDPVGTLLLPGLLLFGQLASLHRVAFMFGWAKPVPVAADRFSDPRRMMALVALAGPAMNFVLAVAGAALLRPAASLPPGAAVVALSMLQLFVLFNLTLGLFNLLPVPPLDGGRIVVGLLPLRAAMAWARLERVGIVLVLLVVFVLPLAARQLGLAFDPVRGLLGSVLPWVYDRLLSLTGAGASIGVAGGAGGVGV